MVLKTKLNHLCILLLFILSSCSSARFVEPLEVGQKQLQISGGGPLLQSDPENLPVPLLSFVIGKGLMEDLTVYNGLHITSAMLNQLHYEGGMLYGLNRYNKEQPWMPGISVNIAMHLSFNFTNVLRLWPQTDLHAYWKVGKHLNLYTGFNNWFEILNRVESDVLGQSQWLFAPHLGILGELENSGKIGIELKFPSPRLNINLEGLTAVPEGTVLKHPAIFLSYSHNF